MHKKTLQMTVLMCLLSLNSFSVLASNHEKINVVKKAIIASTVIAVGFFIPFVDGQSEVAKNHEQIERVYSDRDLRSQIFACLEEREVLHWWPEYALDGHGFVYLCNNKAVTYKFDWLSDECKKRHIEEIESCADYVYRTRQKQYAIEEK